MSQKRTGAETTLRDTRSGKSKKRPGIHGTSCGSWRRIAAASIRAQGGDAIVHRPVSAAAADLLSSVEVDTRHRQCEGTLPTT
jgi:hypothetical protein